VFLAGIYTPGMIGEASIESIKQIIDVNLYGGIALTKAVMPVLERQDHGQIALCASVAGYRGLPGGQPYSCTKAALINFTESLRAVTPRSIDVKVINPGYVDTRLTKQNTHHMPALISTEEAATAMAKGLNSTCFEVHFPKRFTIPAKLFCMLPNWLYFRLVS
jgi:short-subunit dehydrogenase